ncbi:A24 family peptidase [Bacillus kwashiorkori]|uniref:A24 family peptidase n=1 Tax=Bacillus kwashiorkori TaxID=1522318 RepID=UPI0007847F3E|nr:prepilin peptidase [Bacillus kwashiorkori]
MIEYIPFGFLFVFILVAFYFDIRTYKIPNWLTVTGMAVGLLSHLIIFKIAGLMDAGLGLLVGGGVTVLLYLFRAIGGGDVKLFAAIGALSGVEFVLYALMYSIIFAGIIALIILLFTKTILIKLLNTFWAYMKSIKTKSMSELDHFKKNQATKFPFMYAVLPGVVTAFVYVIL